jgi:hypothetical protein
MTRRAAATGADEKDMPEGLPAALSVDSGGLEPGMVLVTIRKDSAPQIIVLVDFPRPEIARTLSANGRAHWGTKLRATSVVLDYLHAALARQYVWSMAPPVRVTYRWIVPTRTKRDQDNHHGSGVVKAIQDALVRHNVLLGGDHSEALESSVEIVYEKGRRALEIVLEEAPR